MNADRATAAGTQVRSTASPKDSLDVLQQDAQAEYILKHLEDYYSSQPNNVTTGSDDDSAGERVANEAAVDEAAAATREGARLVIERALFELARFRG